MQPLWRRQAQTWPASTLLFAIALELTGCASPGPPRPPSLQIPRLVSDLAAERSGDAVTLHFSVPLRTTDGQPLRGTTVTGSLCRQIGDSGRCVPVDAEETRTPLSISRAVPAPAVVWTDELPASLRSGAPRLIGYRVELRDAAGRTGGFSDPVYAAAGSAPPTVAALRAEPMRLGIEVQWTPVANGGEVLLERREPVSTAAHPRPASGEAPLTHPQGTSKAVKPGRLTRSTSSSNQAKTPGLVVLQAEPGNTSAAATIDTGVQEDVPYRYTAVRRETAQLGGHALELRSAPSAEVAATWRDRYPPAAPTALTGLGYQVPADAKDAGGGAPGGYAVDLVGPPGEDTRRGVYLASRPALDAAGEPTGARTRLTAQPVATPGYHDATAEPGMRYRYSVTAIDPKGNESAAVDTAVPSE